MFRYTQSADIWAFGICVLELATGHVPRHGMGFRSLVMQTVHGDVPSLSDVPTKHNYSKVGRFGPLQHVPMDGSEMQTSRAIPDCIPKQVAYACPHFCLLLLMICQSRSMSKARHT